MGSYYNSWSYTAPSGTTEVWINSRRSGASVIVDATVKCTFRYSNDYIAYNGEINFNMWSGSVSTSANIKGYSDRWYYRNESSRTRTCSMTLNSTSSDVQVAFNVTVPAGNTRFSVGTTVITLGDTPYYAPSKPTWTNINPNPCLISSAPLITWGGANAGSLGTLYYDVEVRSTNPNGGWTDWLRIASAQRNSNYNEIVLSGMNVYGILPYVGVKYQYRISSSDGSYATSDWIMTPELSVSFISPTAPTGYSITPSPTKKDDRVTVNWWGANGGSGSIRQYEVSTRYYDHTTGQWSDYTVRGNTTSTSFSIIPTSLYPNVKNNDRIQFRVSVTNSWGQTAWSTSAQLLIRGNQIWIKVNGSWVEGESFIKQNGSWQQGLSYIKVNDSWRESS